MATKSKKQEEFESIRSELMGKINGDEDDGDSGFVSSGNESFDTLRKSLLTKYATDQRKPVRTAPDYRKPAQNGVQQRKPGETVAPFASQRAWEEYYKSYTEKNSPRSLPEPGTTLPKAEASEKKTKSKDNT